jgi:hypothetical protein
LAGGHGVGLSWLGLGRDGGARPRGTGARLGTAAARPGEGEVAERVGPTCKWGEGESGGRRLPGWAGLGRLGFRFSKNINKYIFKYS